MGATNNVDINIVQCACILVGNAVVHNASLGGGLFSVFTN
jgi:hypothetical protein